VLTDSSSPLRWCQWTLLRAVLNCIKNIY